MNLFFNPVFNNPGINTYTVSDFNRNLVPFFEQESPKCDFNWAAKARFFSEGDFFHCGIISLWLKMKRDLLIFYRIWVYLYEYNQFSLDFCITAKAPATLEQTFWYKRLKTLLWGSIFNFAFPLRVRVDQEYLHIITRIILYKPLERKKKRQEQLRYRGNRTDY